MGAVSNQNCYSSGQVTLTNIPERQMDLRSVGGDDAENRYLMHYGGMDCYRNDGNNQYTGNDLPQEANDLLYDVALWSKCNRGLTPCYFGPNLAGQDSCQQECPKSARCWSGGAGFSRSGMSHAALLGVEVYLYQGKVRDQARRTTPPSPSLIPLPCAPPPSSPASEDCLGCDQDSHGKCYIVGDGGNKLCSDDHYKPGPTPFCASGYLCNEGPLAWKCKSAPEEVWVDQTDKNGDCTHCCDGDNMGDDGQGNPSGCSIAYPAYSEAFMTGRDDEFKNPDTFFFNTGTSKGLDNCRIAAECYNDAIDGKLSGYNDAERYAQYGKISGFEYGTWETLPQRGCWFKGGVTSGPNVAPNSDGSVHRYSGSFMTKFPVNQYGDRCDTQLVTNSMLSYSVTAHRYIATVGVLDALSSLSSLLGSTTYLIPFQLHRSTCSAPADCRELPPALFCSFARHRKAPSRRRCLRDGVAMRPKIKWTRLHEGCSENRRGTAKRDRKRQTPKGGRRL